MTMPDLTQLLHQNARAYDIAQAPIEHPKRPIGPAREIQQQRKRNILGRLKVGRAGSIREGNRRHSTTMLQDLRIRTSDLPQMCPADRTAEMAQEEEQDRLRFPEIG